MEANPLANRRTLRPRAPLTAGAFHRIRATVRGEASQPLAQRLAVPVAAAVALFTFLFLQLLHRLPIGTGADFRAMLSGASDLALGRDIYAPALGFLGGGHLRQILDLRITPFVYPPPLALVLRPLTLLPPALAMVVWDALNVSLLAVLFVQIVRISQARTFAELALVGALYGFFPLNMGLGTGQIDLTITILGLLSYLLYRRGLGARSGLVLGVMALIKPTVGILLIFFLCRRAWQVVSAFSVTVAVGLGISWLAVGGRVLWEYRQVATGWAENFGVLPLNQSLHGMLLRLLAPRLDVPPSGVGGHIALLAEVGLLALVIAIVVVLLRRGEPSGLREGTLQYYAVFSVLLLGLPFTENLHLSWLVPGIGILLVVMAQQQRWHPWHACLVAAYMLLALPFAEMLSWRADASLLGRLSSNLDCYGLLVLAAIFCYAAFSGPSMALQLTTPQPSARRRRYGRST